LQTWLVFDFLFGVFVQKVAQAVASALDIGTDIIHEALFLGVDFLQLAPVPGLAEAAKTLLNIWDAVQQVDVCNSTYSRP
jgi:hypothetical protein